jgi:hypothetical protein
MQYASLRLSACSYRGRETKECRGLYVRLITDTASILRAITGCPLQRGLKVARSFTCALQAATAAALAPRSKGVRARRDQPCLVSPCISEMNRSPKNWLPAFLFCS